MGLAGAKLNPSSPRWIAPEIPPAEMTAWQTVALSCYTSEGRHYHTEAHIRSMLSLLESAQAQADDEEALKAAIWFHDAIYVPGARDNEAKSARLAIQALSLAGWPSHRAERVGALILHTAQHLAPIGDPDAALLLDLDLSILGAEEAAYTLYCQQIRMEYPHLTDRAFNLGRLGFLNQMLARPALFQTEWFSSRLEASAQNNLRREQALLKASTGAG